MPGRPGLGYHGLHHLTKTGRGLSVTFYRLYFMTSAERIARAEDLPAPDDQAAMMLACERLRGSGFSHGELWQRAHRLIAFHPGGDGSSGCAAGA